MCGNEHHTPKTPKKIFIHFSQFMFIVTPSPFHFICLPFISFSFFSMWFLYVFIYFKLDYSYICGVMCGYKLRKKCFPFLFKLAAGNGKGNFIEGDASNQCKLFALLLYYVFPKKKNRKKNINRQTKHLQKN